MNALRRTWRLIADDKLATLTLALAMGFTILGVPAQALKIWETKSVADVSFVMYAFLTAQAFCWVLYGRRERKWVVVIPNAFATVFGAIILAQYLYYR